MASRCEYQPTVSTRNRLSITENTRKGVGLKTGMEMRRAVRQPGCLRPCALPARGGRGGANGDDDEFEDGEGSGLHVGVGLCDTVQVKGLSQVCLFTENMWKIAVPAQRKMMQPRGRNTPLAATNNAETLVTTRARLLRPEWSVP